MNASLLLPRKEKKREFPFGAQRCRSCVEVKITLCKIYEKKRKEFQRVTKKKKKEKIAMSERERDRES